MRFTPDDVFRQPEPIGEGVDGVRFVVKPAGAAKAGWVRLSHSASVTLERNAPEWIAEQLNRLAGNTSYGVVCAELLRGVGIPSPPDDGSWQPSD